MTFHLLFRWLSAVPALARSHCSSNRGLLRVTGKLNAFSETHQTDDYKNKIAKKMVFAVFEICPFKIFLCFWKKRVISKNHIDFICYPILMILSAYQSGHTTHLLSIETQKSASSIGQSMRKKYRNFCDFLTKLDFFPRTSAGAAHKNHSIFLFWYSMEASGSPL